MARHESGSDAIPKLSASRKQPPFRNFYELQCAGFIENDTINKERLLSVKSGTENILSMTEVRGQQPDSVKLSGRKQVIE